MRKLILLRHAKSSWKDASLEDFERPLNNRGKRDAPQMANILLLKNIEVDLIISSDTRRTKDTAKIFANILAYNSEIVYDTELYEASYDQILKVINHTNNRYKNLLVLYEASYDQILKVINHTNNRYKNLLVVCHNPGITNLSNYLSNQFIDNIPTTGMVGFSFDGNWNDLQNNSCEILFFEYPKKYKPY